MDYIIKYISTSDAYTVRHPVLRKGKPFESCIFEGDDLDTTFHLGIYKQEQLVGVCTFVKNNHTLLSEVFQYQLRGMAVLDAYQNQGLGAKLVTQGEAILKEKKINVIWCNAREKAANFYKKIGFNIIGEPFNIPNIGKHYIMFKKL
ncbi:GNAT family N-acetyltransferase [Mariniflexile sp.]|uniref:GNAT family N-acetyltransferase n=1 Tax=Mariniflexile sp. TaxID=1979402 RepID=UPI003565687D